jgi:hypothetical protein
MLSAAVPFQGKPDEGRVLEALRKLIGDDDSPGMLVLTVQRKPKPVGYGPGTELKKMLATIGITAEPGCKCNARAAEMDRMEKAFPGWCEANIDLIVGWLREEATKRNLPFVDAAGTVIVRRAIGNARRRGDGKA